MRGDRRFCGLLVALVVVLGACDWSHAGFGAARTGFNPSEPALTATSVQHLTQAWSAPVETSNVVANGVIYTTKTVDLAPAPNVANAFNVSTGATLWTVNVPHASAPDAVGNGLVYYGNTVALDAKTGTPRWSIAQQFLALDGPRLFAVSNFYDGTGRSGQLVAVDPSGKTLWSLTAGGEVTGAVVQGGHLVVVTFIKLDNPPHGLVVVSTYDESSGSLLRRVSVPAQDANGNVNPAGVGIGQLAASDTLIYYVTRGGQEVFAADPMSGAVAWHATRAFVWGLAVTPHAVVVTSANQNPQPSQVTAFNPTTGAALWVSNPTGSVEVPTVAGNLVFIGHIAFNPQVGLLIYDLSNGALITSSTTLCCGPIPSEGHLFVGGLNGLSAMVPSS
jgi:outer membrane protein assembly factor BamB